MISDTYLGDRSLKFNRLRDMNLGGWSAGDGETQQKFMGLNPIKIEDRLRLMESVFYWLGFTEFFHLFYL